MDAVDDVRTKEGVYRKGLVMFMIKAVGVSIKHGHGPAEGPFRSQLVPRHKQKVSYSVQLFLCGGDHVKPLIQKLPGPALGEAVMYHFQQDMDPHCVLLYISWSG